MLFHKAAWSQNISTFCSNFSRLLILLELRDYCDTTRDCREYAYICNRNLCECAEGYRADDKNKTCLGGEEEVFIHFYVQTSPIVCPKEFTFSSLQTNVWIKLLWLVDGSVLSSLVFHVEMYNLLRNSESAIIYERANWRFHV